MNTGTPFRDEPTRPQPGHSVLRRIAARFQHEDHGVSMIEFALVLPIVLALLTGIGAFGVGFNNQLTLNRAVGAGAQYLQLIRTTSTNPCQDVLNAITTAAPNLTPGSLTLKLNLNGTVVSGNSCSGSQSYLIQGVPVSVTATYPCTLFIYGSKALSSCTLTAQVSEYEY